MAEPPDKGKDDKKQRGELLTFPGGQRVDPKDVGANYIVHQSGDVATADIIDPVVINAEVRERIEYVKEQPLVKVTQSGSPTSEMSDLLLLEMAEELAHLKFERRKATKEGKSTANHTIARIQSLRSMMELLFKRKESERAEQLDLKSPRFQSLFKMWMEFFYEAMEKSGIDNKTADLVFQQMKADMVDWERRMLDL
ncbi:MAG TPA: hypothetical protein VIE65_22980 [Methylobacter sp.]|jgi:hypothetical protein